MKFMCLVILDSEIAAGMTPADWEAVGRESLAYDKELMRRGRFIAAEALEGTETARTVRVRAGQAMVTDGPFMETKEQVAGFILVEAADADEAMALARDIPLARIGAVEVRPVMAFGDD